MLADHKTTTGSGRRICVYARLREEMPESERLVLDGWEADPAWNKRAIWLALNQEDYFIGLSAVQEHLSTPKRCICVA